MLQARFKDWTFWKNYEENRPPMPPGSQAVQIASKVAGYVAFAALPRFVDKEGNVNPNRNWARGDRIVDTDGNMRTQYNLEEMQWRNDSLLLNGMRTLGKQSRMEKFCPQYEDSKDEVVLGGYETC